jgi:hypothetical protein
MLNNILLIFHIIMILIPIIGIIYGICFNKKEHSEQSYFIKVKNDDKDKV